MSCPDCIRLQNERDDAIRLNNQQAEIARIAINKLKELGYFIGNDGKHFYFSDKLKH